MMCQRLELTREPIKADIAGFQQRIKAAQNKLSALPAATNWKERKKIEATRRTLTSKIEDVKRLIGYTREALAVF